LQLKANCKTDEKIEKLWHGWGSNTALHGCNQHSILLGHGSNCQNCCKLLIYINVVNVGCCLCNLQSYVCGSRVP